MVSIKQIRDRVKSIRLAAWDDEVAHSAEDGLHQEVLEAIASGAENPAQLAREALQTVGIDFARWCA